MHISTQTSGRGNKQRLWVSPLHTSSQIHTLWEQSTDLEMGRHQTPGEGMTKQDKQNFRWQTRREGTRTKRMWTWSPTPRATSQMMLITWYKPSMAKPLARGPRKPISFPTALLSERCCHEVPNSLLHKSLLSAFQKLWASHQGTQQWAMLSFNISEHSIFLTIQYSERFLRLSLSLWGLWAILGIPSLAAESYPFPALLSWLGASAWFCSSPFWLGHQSLKVGPTLIHRNLIISELCLCQERPYFQIRSQTDWNSERTLFRPVHWSRNYQGRVCKPVVLLGQDDNVLVESECWPVKCLLQMKVRREFRVSTEELVSHNGSIFHPGFRHIKSRSSYFPSFQLLGPRNDNPDLQHRIYG